MSETKFRGLDLSSLLQMRTEQLSRRDVHKGSHSFRSLGKVKRVIGDMIEASAPNISIGSFAQINGCLCEVVGFQEKTALIMALDILKQVRQGDSVLYLNNPVSIPVGSAFLGRVIDPLGRPIDGLPAPIAQGHRPLYGQAPNPMKRAKIEHALESGVRVIDGMLTLGQGQRIAIMAGSGVGKSTLMGMLARNSDADVNVIALVGERGREVREFIDNDLQEEGLRRSVVVVSTSDVSPAMQIKGVFAAMSVAEHFRDQGKKVLVMTDSLTRLAMAQRQIGLSAGEPPATKGYPPSVFTLLPRLLERGGCGEEADGSSGSITTVSTVLIEADDINDPIGDTVRSIVDGHIVLSRRLVGFGHYPPVDVLQSLSRTMPMTVNEEHLESAVRVRRILAVYEENEELIRLGAYKRGSDPDVDLAISLKPEIDQFLRQDRGDSQTFADTQSQINGLSEKIKSRSRTRK